MFSPQIKRRFSHISRILFISILLSGCGGGGGDGENVSGRVNLGSGALDVTFGNAGKVFTSLELGSDVAGGIVVQPDGKIIVVGHTFNGSNTDFLVLRYNSDGTLDTTFGVEGTVVTDFAQSDDGAIGVALDSAGRIIVVGYAYVIGSAYDAVLVVYDSSGKLDPSFNGSGKGLVSFSVYDDFPVGIAVRSDGKILVAGSSFNGVDFDFAMAVSRDSGPSFGSGFVKVTNPIGTGDDFVFSMSLLPSDEVLLAGDSFNGTNFDFAMARYSNTGDLVSTFGIDGKVVSPIGTSHAAIRAVAIQNGKIVVAGFVYNTTDPDVALARYHLADGSLDTTFSGNGIVINPIGPGEDLALSIQVLSDNKILIAGEAFNGIDGDFFLACYNEDGTPDLIFGNAGITTTDFKGGEDTPHALAIQADGKILVAGQTLLEGNNDLALARYDINGTLDPLFKAEGMQTFNLEKSSAAIQTLAIQTDGKILAAGDAINGDNTLFVIVRYTTGGEIDQSFGKEGKLVTPLDGGVGGKIIIRPDGKIFAAGTIFQNGDRDFGLALYDQNGTFEQLSTVGFGANGGENEDYLSALALQPDGKVLVAGSTYSANNFDFALARFDTDGQLDLSFGTGGQMISPMVPDHDVATAIALQADGKIILAGHSVTSLINNVPIRSVSLARYHSDGSLDLSFGTEGKVFTGAGVSGNLVANTMRIQTDGKIIVGGYTIDNKNNYDFSLIRYRPDGNLDSTFGIDGRVVTAINTGNDMIYDLALQADGRIVAIGFSNVANSDFAVVRYKSDGKIDTSFGQNGNKIFPLGQGNDFANAVILQSDGKIIVAGGSLNGTHSDFALLRIWP